MNDKEKPWEWKYKIAIKWEANGLYKAKVVLWTKIMQGRESLYRPYKEKEKGLW